MGRVDAMEEPRKHLPSNNYYFFHGISKSALSQVSLTIL
jgi:hypothetical protein